MAPKSINKIQALREASNTEGDVDDDFLERFAEETGWKSVLLYQYLSGYIVMIALSALTATAISWLEMMHIIISRDVTAEELAKTNYFEAIIYLMDFIYTIDIIFRILYSITRWPNMKLFNEPVPVEFIIIDIVSVIPYDLLYKVVRNDQLVIAILRLRVMLRLYRIGTTLSQLAKMFHEISILSTILWSTALMLLCIIIPSSIHYIFYCYYNGCKFRDYGAFVKTYSAASRYMMTNGADFIDFEMVHIYHVYSLVGMIYFLATMFIVADLACKSINQMKPIYCFIHDFQKTMNLYNYMKEYYAKDWGFEDQQIYFTLKDYYYHYLRQRNGISAERVLDKILPLSITKTIVMDMAFDSFRHSHIFRALDLNIIRFLSTSVQFEFAVPGQVIVRKGDFFDRMIYISHGVLQILSHEDGETPVLNLSGGTSLGETTLFLSYPINCTIICQTYCELIVIKKSVIPKLIQYYPTEYRGLVKSIRERFEDAKRVRGVVHERMDPRLIKSDMLIMSWIKQFQRCFLHDVEAQNTALESKMRALQYYIDSLIFYVAYLDKLVVSEEIELVKDSVFLKATFHFILQPQSPILVVWNAAVILITIFFIIFYPYNLCYASANRSIQTVLTIFVTCIFWLDIYLQIFTAVKTRGATYLTFKTILVYRLRQKEFLIDCFAALPLEYFLIFLTGQMPDVIYMFLQSNRLAKYYRIIRFFDELNIWSTNLLTAFNYVKIIIHFLFFYYYATMMIYLFNCYEDICSKAFGDMLARLEAKSGYRKMLAVIPLANALLTGVIIDQMPKTPNPYIYLGYTAIAVVGYLLKALFLVKVLSSSALQNYNILKQQEYLLGIAESLEWFEVSKSYKIGIHGYLNTLFYFNSEIYSHFNNMVLPPELGASFRNVHLGRILKKNAFFKMISNKLFTFLSPSLKLVIIPANMVVFYCGQAIEECYIIQQGYCTMWYGDLKRDVTINENLGLIEVLLDVPIFHTIITKTDCILIEISKHELQRFFINFEREKEVVYTALDEFARCEHLLSRNDKVFTGEGIAGELTNLFQNENESSIVKIALKDRIKRFMKRRRKVNHVKIISTRSRYLLIWEIVKNTALIMSLSYTGFFADRVSKSVNFYVLLFLDIFCFIDMLLRFGITYFDKNGFEVKRLGRTSLHYFTHAFFIDFLGSFPFDLCLPEGALIFTRFNRYLLTYRIVGLAYYLTNRIKKVRQHVFTALMLIFLLLTTNLANYYVNSLCKTKTGRVQCPENSWFRLSIKKIDPHLILFESLLYLVSIFVGVGFRRYRNVNLTERFILSLWGICGHFAVVIILGRAVSYFLFRNADLTTYQEAMGDLVRFLSYCDIDKNIKYEVIQHFEYIWEKRQGKNIADVIKEFPTSIKKDLLFNIYGKYLRKSTSVFNYAEDNFLKSLLMIVKQETFRKTGVIYRIDDIHGNIFFLLKGSVEVVGPDTNRLTTLTAGSLFGCLDDCTETRQTLTMVAKGHVETLSFLSVEFYKLLSHHPKFHSKFFKMANMHFDFIPSERHSQIISSKSDTGHTSRHSNILLNMNILMTKMSIFRTRVMKPSKHLVRLELTLFIVEFFIGSAYELVLMTIKPTLAFILMAYFRDALWYMRMYMKFHVAYEDEFGMLQFNRKKVALRYISKRDGFYFDLFCLLPFDCFGWLIKEVNMRENIIFIFRLNRFFRSIHLFLYMARTIKKLNINVLLMRTGFIIMYAYIYIVAKFIVYFWSETFLIKERDKSNGELVLNSLNYLDTILFMSTTSPIPHTDFFGGWAPATLCIIICLDYMYLVSFFSNFAGTLQVVTKVKSTYLRICYNLRLLMLICDASTPLIDKVTMYTNILLRIRNGIQFPFLLEQAPYYLREAVLNSMFGFHLRNHYLFKDCHIDFLRQLSATMRTLTYFEGNQICDAGDIDETMYFIQEGVVQALTKDTLYTEVCDHLLVAGESFGLNQIVYPRCGQYYAYRAAVLTTLVTINRSDFVRLLNFFPSVMKHIYNRSVEFAS